LFPQKAQDSFALVNARIGVRGPDEKWSVELWAQNLFNEDYEQVAFNSPFQEGAASAPFTDPQFPGGRQIFSAFLAEPRTYGLTLRTRFSCSCPGESRGRSGRSGGRPSLAGRFEQAPFQRLEASPARDLLADQVGDVESIDRAFAVGGDMRAVDRHARLEEGV